MQGLRRRLSVFLILAALSAPTLIASPPSAAGPQVTSQEEKESGAVDVGSAVAGGATVVVKGGDLLLSKPSEKLPALAGVCTALKFASTAAASEAEKKREQEARDRLIAQWAEILFEVQSETGVSVANLDPQVLGNTMVQIEQELIESAEAEAGADLVPAGYLVNDPAGSLAVGATEVPVDGEDNPLVIGKLIVFPGVPGSYRIKSHYLGGAGTITIEPGLEGAPADDTPLQTEPEWQSFDIARQVMDVAGIVDFTGVTGVVAAYLHPVCGTEEANRSRGDHCWRNSYGRGVGTIPIACNPNLPDHQAGLCYKSCEAGFHGVGPVCWTEKEVSIARGAGVIPAGCPGTHPSFEAGLCYRSCGAGWDGKATICYQGCPAGYRDDGLYCGKQSYGRGAGYALWDKAKCDQNHADVGGCEKYGAIYYPKCKPGFRNKGCCICETAGCPSGWEDIGVSCKKPSRERGVGVARNVCAGDVPELQDGLCYKPCPAGYRGVGPVCWTTTKVSQARGAGLVPDQCPPETPQFDAGLCYQECTGGDYDGAGPVCWGQCGGRYTVDCGAGCATSDAACGMAIAQMVLAPLEVVANIATLGGARLLDSAADGFRQVVTKAAKEITEEGGQEVAETVGKKLGRSLAQGIQANIDRYDTLVKFVNSKKEWIGKKLKIPFQQALDKIKSLGAKKNLEAGTEQGLAAAALAVGEEASEQVAQEVAQQIGVQFDDQFINAFADQLAEPLSKIGIVDALQEAASLVSQSATVRAVKLAEECAKAGITINKNWAGTAGGS